MTTFIIQISEKHSRSGIYAGTIEAITHTQCVSDLDEARDVFYQVGYDAQRKLCKAYTENESYSAVVQLLECYDGEVIEVLDIHYIGIQEAQ